MTVTLTAPISEIKRLLEYHYADPEFLTLLKEKPQEAARQVGVSLDPNVVERFWNPGADREFTVAEIAYRERQSYLVRFRERIRQEGAPDDPRYRAWRVRQVNRLKLELGGAKAESIIHSPMAIELSKGCSVGCWFCGIAASKFAEHFPYSESNAELWKACLNVFKLRIGEAAKWGFCYWATDPLDNPDYEKFCTDFSDILGMFPQTTTAIGHKDPERTRELLQLSESRGCEINRFSVLTLGLLRRLFKQFTAEELLNVECIPQNKESRFMKAEAGKARDKRKKEADKAGEDFVENVNAGTIACVSGFLLNMVEKSVRLITPCRATDSWPLGYMTYQEATFQDAAELDELIEGMFERHMPVGVQELTTVSLAWFLRLEQGESGFALISEFTQVNCADTSRPDYMKRLGQLIAEGNSSADTIAFLLSYQFRVPPQRTIDYLESMFRLGVFCEEPK